MAVARSSIRALASSPAGRYGRGVFRDRVDAGRRLAAELTGYEHDPDVVVVGLPRGGVVVAAEVASALGVPLDVILVRKLGVPLQPELAMGAVGEGGVRVVDRSLVRRADVAANELERIVERERGEVAERAVRFRAGRSTVSIADRTVIIVDDGVATGSTARAACEVARAGRAQRVVLAVPVAPTDWRDRLTDVADDLVAVATPHRFGGVGRHYDDFTQVTDREVIDCLRRNSGPD